MLGPCSSSYSNVGRFNHVSHEARAVPARRCRLGLSLGINSPHHDCAAACGGKAQGFLPLPKTVLAVILAELGFGPALPIIVRDQHLLQAVEAAKGNAAHERGLAAWDCRAVANVGDEGARQHTTDRY